MAIGNGESRFPTVWPDWAIYWTLGNFSKPIATINLPKSPTLLGNFCKGIKIFNFSSDSSENNFWATLVIFFWSRWFPIKVCFVLKFEITETFPFFLSPFFRWTTSFWASMFTIYSPLSMTYCWAINHWKLSHWVQPIRKERYGWIPLSPRIYNTKDSFKMVDTWLTESAWFYKKGTFCVFKQVCSGWPKAVRSIRNSVIMGPRVTSGITKKILANTFYDSNLRYLYN